MHALNARFTTASHAPTTVVGNAPNAEPNSHRSGLVMYPYHEHHIVRIRRVTKKTRYRHKVVYTSHRYGLTIPTKYKGLAEAFMNKDLKIEAKQEGNTLVIQAESV